MMLEIHDSADSNEERSSDEEELKET